MDYQRLKEEHPELEKRLTAMEQRGKKAEMLLALQENVVVKDQHRRVDGHTLASSNTDFAFSLYKQLALENLTSPL